MPGLEDAALGPQAVPPQRALPGHGPTDPQEPSAASQGMDALY